jgi:hypothetical protein
MSTYTVAQIRDGTGWAPGQLFMPVAHGLVIEDQDRLRIALHRIITNWCAAGHRDESVMLDEVMAVIACGGSHERCGACGSVHPAGELHHCWPGEPGDPPDA